MKFPDMLLKNLKHNKREILKIKRFFIQSALKPRIVSLIVHGSALFNDIASRRSADIDVELILSESQANDILHIKKIINKIEVPVECQFRYLNEIKPDHGLIRLSLYKIFMYFAYSNGLCLVGNNIYSQLIKKISKEEVRKSILISLQIAFKDIRKVYLSSDNQRAVNKNIARVLLEICLYLDILNYKKLGSNEFNRYARSAYVPLIINKFRRELTKRDIAVLEKFQDRYRQNKIYPPIFSLIQKITNLFLKKYE